MIERLCGQHVVLLGIGHTNAHVLRMWKMHAPSGVDLTCISDHTIATYSGMLPAVLAQQIEPERMEIDLVKLCASVGARLITDPVAGIDGASNEVRFDDRPPVGFDVLSVGIGSTASVHGVDVEGDSIVLIKPMQTFLQRLNHAVKSTDQLRSGPLRVMIVGSGVAGIEITCCLPSYLASVTERPCSLSLVTRSDVILPEVQAGTRDRVLKELERRDVEVLVGRAVDRVTRHSVTLDNERVIESDVVIWATGAAPPPLLSRLGLDLDPRGFIATDETLQSTSNPGIFAVGDSGTIVSESLPKAGVYAVRQGPVLWNNIQRSLSGTSLESYRPQRTFMKLINLGDGRAVGQWRGMSIEGRWVMRLKERIDGRFMDKFQVRPMSNDSSGSAEGGDEMQCRGCGCKLGSSTLESALASATKAEFEDAAEIGADAGGALVASTDFFSSPLDDPFLTGRIAALHSASDIVATGAVATQALANVVLPDGDRAAQGRMLSDFLEGACLEFDAMGAAVVGGHTIVGPRMEVGFTVIGKRIGQSLVRKRNLREGDKLYVTKPIGIGVLLAAHMRASCPARDYQQLIDAMLQRQHPIAEIASDLQIDAGTDITGFGLAGHIIEMLTSSNVAAEIQIDSVPLLPAAAELVRSGIQSTLAPENRSSAASISASSSLQSRPEYQLLFDPQTCGGLLYGIPIDTEREFKSRVEHLGLPSPQCIGVVSAAQDACKRLTVS